MRILLQTTLPASLIDGWTIERFSLLQGYLAGLVDTNRNHKYQVTGRDRQPDAMGDDPFLTNLPRS
jgi:hypothetical protein